MRKELVLLVLIAFCQLAHAQTAENFRRAWHEIDSLMVEKNLPASASTKVDSLYKAAKGQPLDDEMIRAVLYKIAIDDKITENDITETYKLLSAEIKDAAQPVTKAVLQALLADRLNIFYTRNLWKNQGRKTIAADKDSDLNSWSNDQMAAAIDSLYDESLSQVLLLRNTNIEAHAGIVLGGNTAALRPTLYDLLAQQALDYYKTGLRYVTNPSYAFKLTDRNCLALTNDFISFAFSSGDSTSHLLKALQLFQQLLAFHRNDTNAEAFADVAIQRILWVNMFGSFDNKDELYVNALQDIATKYSQTKSGAEAWFLLADRESKKAELYKPYADTLNRYGYVKAKAIIEERLKAMQEPCLGNDEMNALLNNITSPELSTVAEDINLADRPFRMLVRYKNVDTLYARILLQREVNKAARKKGYYRWKDLPGLTALKTFKQSLPQTNDYQEHSAEIKIDGLPTGGYSILFSNSKEFKNDKDKLVVQTFSVSEIAYMHNEYDYFVVNRETGQPVKDVKVKGTIDVKSKRDNAWKTKKIKTFYTDSNGHIELPVDLQNRNRYGSADLEFSKGKDVLFSYDRVFGYSYSNNEDDDEEDDDSTYEDNNSIVHFFTDRSIYRPGQTVYFKGMVLTKDRKTQKQKLYHYPDSAEIDLNDASGKMIDSIFVKVNDYGSFSGKFHLPQNAMTGEFSIDSYDFMDGEIEFNVEEYKRPTFYIEFDSISNAYRVNDTIILAGHVKAYAGNAIDDAKVSYNIERSASFPYPYMFWKIRRPYSTKEEIADSSIDVDANGKFEIRFVARPDSTIDMSTEPVFNFAVETSVTDANGETRESKTDINIAYRSLLLQVTVPGITDVTNFQNIFVTTKNCAGENVPAVVFVKLSQLKVPAKAYRKRQWEKPDQFIFDKATYNSYFPYDEYEAETDYHEWTKMPAAVSDTFNTATSSVFRLPQKLPQGWYCIEAVTKDKDGSEIKDVRYIQLYDMKAPGLSSPQVNFSQILNNSGLPGDKLQLLFGTSENDVFAVQKIAGKENDTTGSLSYIRLNNEKQKLTYTLKTTDNNNLGLFYAFIKHNSFYKGGMQIYTNTATGSLQISYSSYRNKTEPGSKETWSVQVSDPAGVKTDAEVLTAMYDASLDEFRKQQWEIPVTESPRYIRNDWETDNFGKQASDENMLPGFIITETKRYAGLARSISDFLANYQPGSTKPVSIKTAFSFPPNTPGNYLKIFGVVKSMKDKEPIAGATILAKGTRTATSTNASGEFALAVPPDTKTLVVNSVGFQSLELQLDNTIAQVFLREQISNLNEVVVTGYGASLKKELTGSVAGIQSQSISDTAFVKTRIRGIASVSDANSLLIVIDGIPVEKKIDDINANDIDYVTVLKGSEAINIYGSKAANGVILITTKEYNFRNGKKKKEEAPVQIRKNFNETAFFFPQLHADSTGNFQFSFTMPDALTKWKWMTLAHTKDLLFGLREQNILTQKKLMVQPNLPRFFRQADTLQLSVRISNLSDSLIKGTTTVAFIDAVTNDLLDRIFSNINSIQHFSIDAQRTGIIKFPVTIPGNFNRPVTIRIIADGDIFSDGEENTIPVLSNRIMVTESQPLFMKEQGTKDFQFESLLSAKSATRSSESITVEYTANPAWRCIQALSYLMEFPHECAEQTFNRFYANALSANILINYPAIKKALKEWLKDSTSQQPLLAKNSDIKQILMTETPWVLDATNEAQQQKNIALLFDTATINRQAIISLKKLRQMQQSNGGFAWFKGGNSDRYITQYILTGIARLKKMNAVPVEAEDILDEISTVAIPYLDTQIAGDYESLVKQNTDLSKDLLSPLTIQYWYMRSMLGDENENTFPEKAFRFALDQSQKFWTKQSPYMQGMIAIALNNLFPVVMNSPKVKNTQLDIIKSLKENAVRDSIKGAFWKMNSGYFWYQSPIEMQSLLIEAFNEIAPNDSIITDMKRWLIMNKQTNNWSTTRATADACTALLSGQGASTLTDNIVTINIGDSTISNTPEIRSAAGGYIKHRFDGKSVRTAMGNIEVSVAAAENKNVPGASYGAVYWNYFEDVDKVVSAANRSLTVTKQLFVEKNTAAGKALRAVDENSQLKVGDKLTIRLVIKCDHDMEYIHLKDTRAASMEPENVLSEYKWQDGLGYYEVTKDASTNFFISNLSKGTYVLEYSVHLTHSGNFSAGIASIQCMYAPDFSAHSNSIRIKVNAQ